MHFKANEFSTSVENNVKPLKSRYYAWPCNHSQEDAVIRIHTKTIYNNATYILERVFQGLKNIQLPAQQFCACSQRSPIYHKGRPKVCANRDRKTRITILLQAGLLGLAQRQEKAKAARPSAVTMRRFRGHLSTDWPFTAHVAYIACDVICKQRLMYCWILRFLLIRMK